MNIPTIKSIKDGIIGLLYPDFCISCNTPVHVSNQPICIYCEHQLKTTKFEWSDENTFIRKFDGKIRINHATSAFYMTKESIVQDMMHALKYKGKKEIGVWSGKFLGSRLIKIPTYKDIDCIIPIPLHINKLRKRGYNQSTQFAIGLSNSMQIPYINNKLIRTQNNASQTKQTRDERLKNVYIAFKLLNPDYFKGKHVLIVDDVVTTGSTLESCALLFGDDVKISFATIAYASYY